MHDPGCGIPSTNKREFYRVALGEHESPSATILEKKVTVGVEIPEPLSRPIPFASPSSPSNRPSSVTATSSGLKIDCAISITCSARDGFDLVEDLLHAEEILEVHLLPGEVGHARHGAFEREQDVAFQLIFGALELVGGERFFLKPAKFGHDEFDYLDCLGRRCAGVDAERACVPIGVEVAVDGVGEAALFADRLEESRAHAAAENGIQNERDVAVLVGDRLRRDAEAELHLFERFLVAQADA